MRRFTAIDSRGSLDSRYSVDGIPATVPDGQASNRFKRYYKMWSAARPSSALANGGASDGVMNGVYPDRTTMTIGSGYTAVLAAGAYG